MKLLRRQSGPRASTPHVVGIARVGPRTKDLAKRIGRGDIAIIDHRDLDRIAAESLLAAGVAAIVNADQSISGRYPNGGPERVVAAHVPLLDAVGSAVMETVHDGEVVEIHDGALWRNGEKLAAGEVLHAADVEQRMEEARLRIGTELRSFARNTLEYIDKEAEQSFQPLVLPPLKTKVRGRQALVVVRGLDYKSDLRALRAYIREYRPVLIAVDGGADALLDDGRTPDIIIGDFDSLSPVALHCGAELVHHVHPDGRLPGLERLEAAGVKFERFVTEGTSEDAALLLAFEAGADLIVAVGTHATMVEFLDKGRRGMASTFLTRLRLGPMLVDAKGVSRLYQGRVRPRDMVLLVVAALAAMVAMVYASHSLRVFLDGFRLMFDDTWAASARLVLTMINFRFHLVSLIAVFLAMGLGILVGSTVVDQVIVDRLDREISSVSHESNQLKDENRALKDQVSQLNDFLRKSSAYAVERRLADVPVAIVAEKGIDATAVNNVLASVRAAGGDVPGVLWLDPKWRLDTPKDLRALQSAARVTGNAAATRQAALRALATRLSVPAGDAPTRRRDVIEPLRSAGFLDFTDGKRATLAAFPAHSARVLLLTGTDSQLSATDTMVDLVQSLVDTDAPTVLGEVYDAKGAGPTAPKRGAALEPVRGDPPLAKVVTTLDDAELPQGALTSVIALDQISDGTIGHYGYGEGASETIPPISQ